MTDISPDPSSLNGLSINENSSALLFGLVGLPIALVTVLLFSVYSVHLQLFSLLGNTVSISLTYSNILFIAALAVLAIWMTIRYRILTVYSRLPPEPARDEPKLDIFLDPRDDDDDYSKNISGYLDDFLSAIKIFGYLERPVFHELTRHMQTHKLEAGESIQLSDEQGFSIVVDGAIDIFVKSGGINTSTANSSNVRKFGHDTYYLLNQVKRGAPLSSLFTILALFTEDVQLNDDLKRAAASDFPFQSPAPVPQKGENDDVETHLLDPSPQLPSKGRTTGRESFSSPENGAAKAPAPSSASYPVSSSPGLSEFNRSRREDSFSDLRHGANHSHHSHQNSSSQDQNNKVFKFVSNFVAEATVQSTIAVIPAATFRKMIRKYPQATAHIVQVILTRCQRVTLHTGHSYLGLTPEIFQTEIALNRTARYELPNYLREAAVRWLKKKHAEEDPEKESVTLENSSQKQKHHPHHSPGSVPAEQIPPANPHDTLFRTTSRHVILEPDTTHPGDLLSHVPLPKKEIFHGISVPSTANTTPEPSNRNASDAKGLSRSVGDKVRIISTDETEESTLRATLAECIFTVMGLNGVLVSATGTATKSGTPLAGSPAISPVAMDSFRDRLDSNRRGSIGLLSSLQQLEVGGGSSIDDASSVTSSAITGFTYEAALQRASSAIELILQKKDSVLVHDGDANPGVYYVIDGILEVGHYDRNKVYREIYTIHPGGIAGFLGSISGGHKSIAEIRAKTDCYLGFLPQSTLEKIGDKYPLYYLNMAKTLTSVLTPFIFNLDFAMEWVQVKTGQVIFHERDEADSIYIVLTGRLRAIHERKDNSTLTVQGEFGHGDSIGELEVLTETSRPFTLHAIRDSELAKFPRHLFEGLALQHPSITIQTSRLVASRVRKLLDEAQMRPTGGAGIPKYNNFRTVAIIPVTTGLPVGDFGQKLFNSFVENGRKTYLLDNASVLSYLGRNAFNKLGKLKLSGYLADLEERYDTILYVADTIVTASWTQICLSQADCILLIASALSPPEVGEYERLLVKMRTTARTELVLMHPEKSVTPGLTSSWLKSRTWVHAHHHVQMKGLASSLATSNIPANRKNLRKIIKDRVLTLQYELVGKYRSNRLPIYSNHYLHKNDFNRLARILSGNAVGLVLGGGGARGVAHIGIIKALEENGIPIDMVGGTSIGSFVGGLYAKDYDLVPIYGRAKHFAGRVSSLWRMVLDLTYPATSYTTGHEFNRGIWKAFGESRIEDFWLQYFNNTTNITHSRMEVHHSGYAWRYVRASMSLAGLLPPLTDGGSMLLDGGYVDNLPVSEMQRLGAKVIFAVDVGSIDDTTPMSYGDTLSGLWVIFNRWNPFSSSPNVPSMAEIQSRLAYVSSVGSLETAKTTPGVLYLRPPIDNYATLDFGKFDEIYHVGTVYGHQLLKKWKEKGVIPRIPGSSYSKNNISRKVMTRRNSI